MRRLIFSYMCGALLPIVCLCPFSFIYKLFFHLIGGVMVSVLTSSAVYRGFIGGIMVSVLDLSTVDRWFEPRAGQIKDYKIGIC